MTCVLMRLIGLHQGKSSPFVDMWSSPLMVMTMSTKSRGEISPMAALLVDVTFNLRSWKTKYETEKSRSLDFTSALPKVKVKGPIKRLYFLFFCHLHLKLKRFQTDLARLSIRGVVSWTCDPVLALGQRFDSHFQRLFCCNPPLGKLRN